MLAANTFPQHDEEQQVMARIVAILLEAAARRRARMAQAADAIELEEEQVG